MLLDFTNLIANGDNIIPKVLPPFEIINIEKLQLF